MKALDHMPNRALYFTLRELREAITIRAYSRRIAPLETRVALAAARFFRKQGIAYGHLVRDAFGLREAEIQPDVAPLLDTLSIDLGTLAAEITKCYVTGQVAANADYALGIKFDLKNPRAVAYAKERATELLRELDKTTKDDIQQLVINAVENGTSPQVLARSIASLFVSYARKERGKQSRAERVAITEVGRAYQAGNYGAILDASGTGLEFEKSWLPVANACPICQANADQGWIAFGAAHSSGSQYPPAHPSCRCAELYRRAAKSPTAILNKKVYNAEKSIRNQTYESAFVFAPDGTQLLFKDGTRDTVEFTDKELDLFSGAILTHNHPSIGGSFSPQDILTAIENNLAEIRAVGAQYRYSLKFPKGSIRKYFQNQVDYAETQVRKQLTQKIRDGAMTPAEADLEHYHQVWLRFVQTHRWEYTREVWND